MDTYDDVFKIKNIKDDIIIIKNNIYFNFKFIDKLNSEILGIIYNKKDNRLFVLSERIFGIYSFENIDNEIEIVDIKTIENKYKLKKIGENLQNQDIVFKKNISFFKLEGNKIINFNINKDIKEINWSDFHTTKKELARQYLNIHQGDGVSVIRVLTELHNGKFFGSIFTFILFLSSLSLLFLTISSFIFITNLFKKENSNIVNYEIHFNNSFIFAIF